MEEMKRKRFHFFDECRGFLIILVLIFHTLYDLTFFFYTDFGSTLYYFFEPSVTFFASLFIILCGICCFFSRSNLKRGLILLAISAVITIGSLFLIPDCPIYFGILHLLSISILLFIPLKKLIMKISISVGMAVSIILFALTYNLSEGYIGFSFLHITLPPILYSIKYLLPFGFLPFDISTADFFPIFPFLFIFIFGAFIGRLATEGKLPPFFEKKHIPFLAFVGRHSLLLYIAQQPVVYGILFIIFSLTK